jgi:hypothetical protein
MTKTEMQQQALENARSGESVMNYSTIFQGFMTKGIAETDIKPREMSWLFTLGKPWVDRSNVANTAFASSHLFRANGRNATHERAKERSVAFRRPHAGIDITGIAFRLAIAEAGFPFACRFGLADMKDGRGAARQDQRPANPFVLARGSRLSASGNGFRGAGTIPRSPSRQAKPSNRG